MCVCGAQHVCSKHLQEDSVACSKRGGLGSDLASLLGLIQSMTAWKLTIGRQYWHTNPSPSELHSYNIPAKWRSLVWVLSQMWCSPVRILLNAYCNFAWYESHTKKTCLKLNWAVEGILLFVQTDFYPTAESSAVAYLFHHLLFSGIFFRILFCTEFSWYILFWNVKYLLLTISDNSIYRFSQTTSSISHFLISRHYNLVCFISTNHFSLRGITRRLVIVFDIVQTELAEQMPHRFAGWLRPLEQCDPPSSDPGWQRREPFKDSDCGEQTLDALCRAPPAGLGTVSTLLAPVLPWSIEAFCEWEQPGGIKRQIYYPAFLWFYFLKHILLHCLVCLLCLPLC